MDYAEFKALKASLQNLVLYGSLSEIDKIKHKARVQIGDILTNWLDLPRIGGASFAVFYLPPKDTGVLILAPFGKLENAYIINYYSTPNQIEAEEEALKIEFEDGSFLHYKTNGDFELKAKTIKLISDSLEIDAKTQIKHSLEVTRDIKTQGSLEARGDVVAGPLKIKLTTHKHTHPYGPTTGVLP